MTNRFIPFHILITSVLLIFITQTLVAQNFEPIVLNNPSFEDIPQASRTVSGWLDCGAVSFPSESPPDVHPVLHDPAFSVTKVAQDGISYLGMVVRSNESWESVGQRLQRPLRAGECYEFSIALSRSSIYLSSLRGAATPTPIDFTEPIKLRIWGGTAFCDKGELLAESGLVQNTTWRKYDFKFEPTEDHSHIILEAFFQTPALFPPNGNLLIDNASAIQPVPCEEEAPLVKITSPKRSNLTAKGSYYTIKADIENIFNTNNIRFKVNGELVNTFSYNVSSKEFSAKIDLQTGNNNISIVAYNNEGSARDETTLIYRPVVAAAPPPNSTPKVVEKPKVVLPKKETILGVKKEELKKGQTLSIDKLFFAADSYTISGVSFEELDEIYEFLRDNPEVRVEIGGHTNRVPKDEYCDKLSAERAKAVMDYLIEKGIPASQLEYKGYGKREPLIMGNITPYSRKKNQRVEVKILGLRGR